MRREEKPMEDRQGKRSKSPMRIGLGVFTIFLAVVSAFCALGYYFYYTNVQNPLGGFIRPVSRGQGETGLNGASSGEISGRSWNILLLGSDNDNKYTFPVVLTQVMMVVHVDTANNTIQMVSIPRDSWVNVPGANQMHKIDQAFFYGATQGNSFENGIRFARQTIEQDYGIPIDRYGWVGLNGFAKVVDTLGGIDVDIMHPLVDDTYPKDTGKQSNPNDPNAYRRLYLAPGPQHLDGEEALEYVRSRHADLIGDIGRTQRQQQVIQALKLKLNVPNIVDNFQALLKDLSGQVYTDLNEGEILAFANFARSLNSNSIQKITLGPGNGAQSYGNYANVYDPAAGSTQSVIIPQCENIQPLVNRIFTLGELTQSCRVLADQ